MDYNSLKYIITVDKFQSISKAAEELYLSQPNISKAIQNLEKEIGFQIFVRTSRGVITTPEGKELIKKAHKLVKQFDDFNKEFKNIRKQIFNMNIAHPKDIYFQNKVIEIAKNFKNETGLNINVLEGTTEEIIDMTLKEYINLGIICVNEHDFAHYKKLLVLNNLDYKITKPMKLKATIHSSNSLYDKETFSKYELENQILITTNANDYYTFYNEKYHILLSKNVIKTSVGLNQVSLLTKIKNSYLISLPLSNEILDLYNCRMIDLESGIGDWITLFIHKKTSDLTKLEQDLIESFM